LRDFAGRRFGLAEYRGTPLVVNLWASCCPFCIAEMPDFEKVHQALGAKVAFLGINQRDCRAAADVLAHATHVSYLLASDPQGVVFDAFGATGMPTTAFIAVDGRVLEVVSGQLSRGQLRALIHDSSASLARPRRRERRRGHGGDRAPFDKGTGPRRSGVTCVRHHRPCEGRSACAPT
jgi:thiol-disulfide isomerase/thioredoxin